MRYLTELICDLYRLTDHHKLTTATFKNLADIKLFKPTADADTILQLENIFSEYSLRYIDKDLAEILSNLITTDKKHSLDFDFNKIQSLTDSKSFGCGWRNRSTPVIVVQSAGRRLATLEQKWLRMQAQQKNISGQ